MSDIEFYKFWISLNTLQGIGSTAIVLKKSSEEKVKTAIEKRYGKRDDNKTVLRNVELIFI